MLAHDELAKLFDDEDTMPRPEEGSGSPARGSAMNSPRNRRK